MFLAVWVQLAGPFETRVHKICPTGNSGRIGIGLNAKSKDSLVQTSADDHEFIEGAADILAVDGSFGVLARWN